MRSGAEAAPLSRLTLSRAHTPAPNESHRCPNPVFGADGGAKPRSASPYAGIIHSPDGLRELRSRERLAIEPKRSNAKLSNPSAPEWLVTEKRTGDKCFHGAIASTQDNVCRQALLA
jgi:hypothetical protein